MGARTVGIHPLTVVAVSQAATVYSSAVKTNRSTGEVALLVTITGTTGITITQQCSLDGITFYDAVDASNNAVGAVVSAAAAGTRYVVYSPALANYMRFKVVENNTGPATVTLSLMMQEEV